MSKNPIAKNMGKFNKPKVIPDKRRKLREKAERNVKKVYGEDSPGYEACVLMEMAALTIEKSVKKK